MLAKQLEYLADAQSAGIVLGARVPIVLTSRADNLLAHTASCALAMTIATEALNITYRPRTGQTIFPWQKIHFR